MQLAVLAMVAATATSQLACPPAAPVGPSTPVVLQRPAVAACTAAAPSPGASFSGTVLQVIDGRTLCVASGPSPDQWVRVTLTDAGPNTGRGALMAAAFAKEVVCVAGAADGDGVAAVCMAGARSLGRAATEPEATAQAADWR